MFRLFMLSSVLRLVVNLLSSLKSLIRLLVVVIICGFVYLLYTNGMDVQLAIAGMMDYAKRVIDWLKGMWALGTDVFS